MKRTIKCILSLALAVLLFAAYLPASVNAAESYTRLYGETRYETAFAAADALKEQLGIDRFNSIVVADGLNFADALSGSYLAAVKNAPILLVSDSKIKDVQAYISENLTSGGTVYILGGTNAVSEKVENSLTAFNVVRLAGATRYETNLEILEEAGVDDQEILICTGTNFADSLSASAVGKPILLVGSALTDGQKAFLQSGSGAFVIIGGINAISEALESQLSEYGVVERLSGETRYETSIMVAERFFTKPESAVLAYAKNFPDGLCGGPLAYAMDAPLILTATGSEAAANAYASENEITSGLVLGGNGLISDSSCQKIFEGNAHSHSYTSKVTKDATCTEDGAKTFTCSCGDSYTETITARGHKWGNWVVTKEPTASSEGQETRTCSICKETETRKIDKLPAETEPPHTHKYSEVVTKPTCTEKGYTTYTCSCGDSYKGNEKPATGHAYQDKVTAPTCEKDGYTTHTCGNCGHSYTDTAVKATGHSWGNWVVTKEATVDAEGEETRTCGNCGKTETRKTDKLPAETEPPATDDGCTEHNWGAWTSDWNGSYRSCEKCGEQQVIDGSNAQFVSEVVTYVNEYRVAAGLAPLTERQVQFGLIRAEEITIQFDHRRLNNKNHGMGECIATGSSAKSVVDAWYNSSSHNGTLLDKNATIITAARCGGYWVVLIG